MARIPSKLYVKEPDISTVRYNAIRIDSLSVTRFDIQDREAQSGP